MTSHPAERESLLHQHYNQRKVVQSDDQWINVAPERFLPIALLAALGMSSTAATSYYAYATLICDNAAQCEKKEKSHFASAIATATLAANIIGIFVLGHLQKLATRNRRLALSLWLVTRSMSPVMLFIGVSVKNILVALTSRIIEGLASDNLLHYLLNSVYAQSGREEQTSSLIGYSLGLFLAGVSVSPFVAGLFKSFTTSFFIAIGIFAITTVYLQILHAHENPNGLEGDSTERTRERNSLKAFAKTVTMPFETFRRRPSTILIGLTMLAYNMVQSYIFSALLVHTSVYFGFTGRENGFLVSIAHVEAAIYIFFNLYGIPRAKKYLHRNRQDRDKDQYGQRTLSRDAILALISLFIQTLSLVGIGLAKTPGHIYASTALLALSLPANSFIKAAFISRFEGEDKTKALTSLAAMETLGGVLGPMAIGGLQSYSNSRGAVFLVAAAVSCTSATLFCLGVCVS